MGKSGRVARDIFFWTFNRGTLPYDILCGLILAFIFFVPRACFSPKPKHEPTLSQERTSQNSVLQGAARLSREQPEQGKQR